ncbi:ADP-ribosylglycohydrolase family protein [Rubripirellula tenax]|nr:ADP-ribosylglycohydrolase family protein [Rubripirellula tenax]
MTQRTPSLFDDFDDESFSVDSLDDLIDQRRIPIRRGDLLSSTPISVDVQRLRADHRVAGMLIGVGVGDALGHSTEWRFDPDSRHQRFGTIVDHLRGSDVRAGRISDDAQMTFWTVERLLSHGRFEFDDVVGCFVDRQGKIVGMGKNTGASLTRHHRRLQSGRASIESCAGDPIIEGRGNGGLMRFAPIVLPYLRQPSNEMYADAIMSTLATHGNSWALASIAPMTHLLWSVLARDVDDPPPDAWWLDEYIRVGADIEIGPMPYPLDTDPIPRWFQNFRGGLCDFLDGPVRDAFRKGVPLRDACSLDGFGSRADILQTVPAVLYTLMCHADDMTSSLIAAVNDTKDNDTIAAIVGAYVGAIHGRKAIRGRWIDGITSYSLGCQGKESRCDRDVMIEMAEAAEEKFS